MATVDTKFLQPSYSPCYSTANGFGRTVPLLTPLKKPEIGRGSTTGSARCQGLRRVRGRPAPRTWHHHTFSCGVISSPRCRPRSLECLRDPVKSAVCACRRSCAALRRRPCCDALNCILSETVVISIMSPASPKKMTPGGEYPLKQNIFGQTFMWCQIYRYLTNATWNICNINSSNFFETSCIVSQLP